MVPMTACSPQSHWASHTGSLCAVQSDPATGKSLFWPAPSSQQARSLSFQGSLTYEEQNNFIASKKSSLQIITGNMTQHSMLRRLSAFWIVILEQRVHTYPEEDCFDFVTVLPSLVLHIRIKYVFGRDTGVSNTFAIAYHPDEDVRNTVLGLEKKQNVQIKNVYTK